MEKQQNKIRITLNKKLLLIILPLNIISLIAAGMVFYRTAKTNIQTRVSEYMQQYLVQLTRTVDNELNMSIQINAQLAVNTQVRDVLENYEAADAAKKTAYREMMAKNFVSLNSIYDNIKGIYIFDSFGNEFYDKKSYGQDYEVMQQMEWYQNTLEKEGDYEIFLDVKSGIASRNQEQMIGIARSVMNIYSKETYGIVLTEIPYSALEDCVYGEKHQLNLEQGNIFILNEKNELVYSTNPDGISPEDLQKNFEETLLGKTESKNLEELPSVQLKKLNGKEMIQISYFSKEARWNYIYLCEMKQLMQDMDNIRLIISGFILIMGVVSAGISVLFSKLFLKPLQDLVQGMKKVAAGDYDVCVQSYTQDELSYLIGIFNDMTKSIKNLIQKVYQAEITQKEAELEILQQQINPHFLYNTLESMRGLALEENCPKVADMAKNMSSFMRYNMQRGHNAAMLSDEELHVKYYIRLINYRFDHKIDLKTEIPQKLRTLSLPRFTLQPIVENAVLHGLAEKRENCEIMISAAWQDEIVVIQVKDNGTGIPKKKLAKMNAYLHQEVKAVQDPMPGGSAGIFNVNSRLKLNYGMPYGISLESREGEGTTVTIRIPCSEIKDAGSSKKL